MMITFFFSDSATFFVNHDNRDSMTMATDLRYQLLDEIALEGLDGKPAQSTRGQLPKATLALQELVVVF